MIARLWKVTRGVTQMRGWQTSEAFAFGTMCGALSQLKIAAVAGKISGIICRISFRILVFRGCLVDTQYTGQMLDAEQLGDVGRPCLVKSCTVVSSSYPLKGDPRRCG
jgi:hypothetical protein